MLCRSIDRNGRKNEREREGENCKVETIKKRKKKEIVGRKSIGIDCIQTFIGN